jgi:hypothetical protein
MPNFTSLVSFSQIQTLNRQKSPSPFRIRAIYQLLVWLMSLFGFTHLASAQTTPPINWQKTYGGSGSDIAYAMKPTLDGGYIVVGSTESNDGDVSGNHGGTDFWIVKLDATGAKIWQQTLGGSGTDVARGVVTTSDGGCVIAGYTNSPDGDVTGFHGGTYTYYESVGGVNYEHTRYMYDYWVIKLDRSGNIVWQKTLGGTGDDQANAITASSDGGFIVAGSAGNTSGYVGGYESGDVSGNRGEIDFWVVKLTNSGNLVWQKSLGGSGSDYAYAVTATSDGGCAVAGYTISNNKDVTGYHKDPSSAWYYTDYWVVKVDGSGNLVWQKALGGSYSDTAFALTTTGDGGYVVAGYSVSSDGDVTAKNGGQDFWVVKLNGLGNIVWQRTIGGFGSDNAYAVTATTDGGFIVAGETNPIDNATYPDRLDVRAVKLDASGAIIWEKTLGGTKEDRAFAVLTTADGGFMVAGSTASSDGDVTGNRSSRDFWVVKLGAVAPLISNLQFSHDPVCSGKPVLLTASISNITGPYNYTITNGASVNRQDTSSVAIFSQTLTIGDSGLQSLTLTVSNTAGSNSAVRRITVVNDGNCTIPTPCVAVWSGTWDASSIWLCGHVPTVADLVILSPNQYVLIPSYYSAQAQRIRYNGGRLLYNPGAKLFLKGD